MMQHNQNCFNMDEFKDWLIPTNELFKKMSANKVGGNGNNKSKKVTRRIFIDRGSPVLFVAHLDTVQKPKFRHKVGDRIYAQGLDDRLGAYIADKLARILDVDLLLTDLEESGQSTAEFHKLHPRYNWIAEFDRAGNDVVNYGLTSADWDDALTTRWDVEHGLYSDIASLDTDLCCLNLGIGYEEAHEKNSYFDIEVFEDQIGLFLEFFWQHKETRFVQDLDYNPAWYSSYKVRNNYNSYSDGYDTDICDICYREPGREIWGYMVCQCCLEAMITNSYSR